jgi:hypothetical protein
MMATYSPRVGIDPSLGLHHPEILSLGVATFKGGRSIPALAVLDRRGAGASDGKSGDPWDAVNHPEHATTGGTAIPRNMVVPLARKCHRATSDVPVTPPADSRPPQA